MVKPGDFSAAQQQTEEEVRVRDIDLSLVFGLNSMKKLQVSGKYIVVFPLAFSLSDPDQVSFSAALQPGSCFVRVGSNTKVPVALVPGTAYEFDEFSELWILNTVAQPGKMIRLYISTNPIVKIAAPPQTISGSVAVTETNNPLGASMWDLSPGAAGVTQIIAPGSNINGAVIRDGYLEQPAAGAILYADTTAPSGVADVTHRTMLGAVTNAITQWQMPYPRRLIAGIGLWLAVGAAGARSAGTYDLL
jgi:hypothetical protein